MEKKVPVMGCIMLWILLLGKKKTTTHTHKNLQQEILL